MLLNTAVFLRFAGVPWNVVDHLSRKEKKMGQQIGSSRSHSRQQGQQVRTSTMGAIGDGLNIIAGILFLFLGCGMAVVGVYYGFANDQAAAGVIVALLGLFVAYRAGVRRLIRR